MTFKVFTVHQLSPYVNPLDIVIDTLQCRLRHDGLCTRSSGPHSHVQSREYHKKPCPVAMSTDEKTTCCHNKQTHELPEGWSTSVNVDSDTKEKTTSESSHEISGVTPLERENCNSLEDLVFLSKTTYGQRFCEISLIDVNFIP